MSNQIVEESNFFFYKRFLPVYFGLPFCVDTLSWIVLFTSEN